MKRLELGDRLTLAILTFIGLLGVCGASLGFSAIIATIEFLINRGS